MAKTYIAGNLGMGQDSLQLSFPQSFYPIQLQRHAQLIFILVS